MGKARFVFETALGFGLTMVGANDAFEYLSHGGHYISLGNLIYYLLAGIPIGLIAWSSREAKYQKTLAEVRAKALSSGNTTPHSGV